MAESSDYIRQIYEADIGQPADEAGIQYWQKTGLKGDDLIKAMRYSAGMDTRAYDDPAYAAFARTLRNRTLSVQSDRDNRLQEIRRNRMLALANLSTQRDQALERDDRDAEARGMYQSGGRIAARARTAETFAGQEATTDLGYANQEQEVARTTSQTLADLSASRDEQEVAARGRLTQQSIAATLAGQTAPQLQAQADTARATTRSQAATARQPRARTPLQVNRTPVRTSSPTRYVQPTGMYRPVRRVN